MPFTGDFDAIWKKYQDGRAIGRTIVLDPEKDNRCALVLGLALSLRYKPRPGRNEVTFREISRTAPGIQKQPFLDSFYVKAEQLAHRLQEEWGPPDVFLKGSDALSAISGKRGVIFIENAWAAGTLRGLLNALEGEPVLTVDHIDLWNGQTLASTGPTLGHYKDAIERAEWVWLWIVRDKAAAQGA